VGGDPVETRNEPMAHEQDLSDEALTAIETAHPAGLTSQGILDALDGTKFKISEATLRKWVQLGLLPRSVRVGRKGKHQGSQGMYPSAVIRQIKRIKEMMASDFTIEEIQREFLFARGDIEATERTLSKTIDGLDRAIAERAGAPAAKVLKRDLEEARTLAGKLVDDLTSIEDRLTMQARLRRAAV
jgi:DNA-binding transcriptional MerR regulator